MPIKIHPAPVGTTANNRKNVNVRYLAPATNFTDADGTGVIYIKKKTNRFNFTDNNDGNMVNVQYFTKQHNHQYTMPAIKDVTVSCFGKPKVTINRKHTDRAIIFELLSVLDLDYDKYKVTYDNKGIATYELTKKDEIVCTIITSYM